LINHEEPPNRDLPVDSDDKGDYYVGSVGILRRLVGTERHARHPYHRTGRYTMKTTRI
jgi:hypothetical protein